MPSASNWARLEMRMNFTWPPERRKISRSGHKALSLAQRVATPFFLRCDNCDPVTIYFGESGR